jgi:hypothetical protein
VFSCCKTIETTLKTTTTPHSHTIDNSNKISNNFCCFQTQTKQTETIENKRESVKMNITKKTDWPIFHEEELF